MHFNSELSFNWLLSRDMSEAKELSRALLACHLWKVQNRLAPKLIRLKKEGSWNCSLRDTARASSALAAIGIVFPDVSRWILAGQKEGSWNNDVYDTSYALTALADMGIENREGCLWLTRHYATAWEHPGTTALILQALISQEKLRVQGTPHNGKFIHERARWLLTQRDAEGAWETIATSNLVMQALLLAGCDRELDTAHHWLLSRMNDNGSWGKYPGDITASSLSLITLAQFNQRRVQEDAGQEDTHEQ